MWKNSRENYTLKKGKTLSLGERPSKPRQSFKEKKDA